MSHILTYCTLKMLNTVNLLFIIGGVQWDKHGYAIIDRFYERYLVYALEMLLSIPSPPWRLHEWSSKIALEILKAATN